MSGKMASITCGMTWGDLVIKYDFENKFPLWHTHPGRVLKTNQILVDDEIVQAYPDNDGGLWYKNKDGKVVVVDE